MSVVSCVEFMNEILFAFKSTSVRKSTILDELSPKFVIIVSILLTLSTKSVSKAIPVSKVPSPINLEASTLPVTTKPVVSFVS